MNVESIAALIHDTYQQWLGMSGLPTSQPWASAEQWEKDSFQSAVGAHIADSSTGTGGIHETWMDWMLADGWHMGPLVNSTVKQNSWLVPNPNLNTVQQMKYRLAFLLSGLFATDKTLPPKAPVDPTPTPAPAQPEITVSGPV